MDNTAFILSGVLVTLLSAIYFTLEYGRSEKITFLSFLFTPYLYCTLFALNEWSIFGYSESPIQDVLISTMAMLSGGFISFMLLVSSDVFFALESWYREYQRTKNKSP